MSIALHRFALLHALALTLLLAAFAPMATTFAQSAQVGQSSGLPIPRFVSIRNAPTNVRVGPGTQYDIAFTFLKPGMPVEITAEFDTWRRIRDVEGDEGWVHQNLIVGDRQALVAPWQSEGTFALRVSPDPESAVRAWLSPGILVSVRSCDGRACEVGLNHTSENGTASYRGWLGQQALWGVYENEIIE